MEIKLEYFPDSVNTLEFKKVEIELLRKIGICILKYTV